MGADKDIVTWTQLRAWALSVRSHGGSSGGEGSGEGPPICRKALETLRHIEERRVVPPAAVAPAREACAELAAAIASMDAEGAGTESLPDAALLEAAGLDTVLQGCEGVVEALLLCAQQLRRYPHLFSNSHPPFLVTLTFTFLVARTLLF